LVGETALTTVSPETRTGVIRWVTPVRFAHPFQQRDSVIPYWNKNETFIYFFMMKRKIPTVFCSVALVLIPAILSHAQTRADFIIVADPSVYTIFNGYQQPLSKEEASRFLPHAPLRIIEKQVVLGDQITRALKFSYRDETGYLLIDENGALVGEKNRSNRQTQNNCEVFNDTVELLGDGMRLSPPQGKSATLKKGERLSRVFRSNNRYYVLAIDAAPPSYGWCALETKNAWKRIGLSPAVAKGSDTLLPPELKNRLVKRIEQANRSYEATFNHFNARSGDDKRIPRWQIGFTPSSITFTLNGPWNNSDELASSTQYLKRDLETMLLGTGFWLSGDRGTIVIKRMAQGK
jgi:hypothetical protein